MSASPRVAIDVRMAGHSGIGTYIRGLIGGMREIGIPDDIAPIALVGDPVKIAGYPELAEAEVVVPFGAPIYSLREQFLFPIPKRAALLHFPHYNVPRLVRTRFVVTIHDLIHLLMPEVLGSRLKRAISRSMLQHAAARATAVLTVSEWSRRDIAQHLRIPEDRILVTPNAVTRGFQCPPAETIARLRRELALPPRFFLAVGVYKPHKNFEFLVRCFVRWTQARGPEAPSLILCGPDKRGGVLLERLAVESGAKPGAVRVLPYLEHARLPGLYAAAEALIFPSLYEGFGLPPLEAQRVGIPVLASNASCIPEVAGHGARYFDPRSERELHAALSAVLDDPDQTRRLVETGRANEQRFSWETTASLTLAAYRQAMG